MYNKKTVLIIGGSGGIGLSVVNTLRRTFNVIATTTSTKGSKKISLVKQENGIVIKRLNLEKSQDIKKIALFAKEKKVDWVINCAGYIYPENLDKAIDARGIKKTFMVNAESVIRLSLLMTPLIKSEGGFINISSTAGIYGNKDYPVYSSSKAAINVFLKALSKKETNKNIKIITICPGPTNTSMREKLFGDSRKYQKPEKIGNLVKSVITKKREVQSGDILVIKDGLISNHLT